MSFLLVLVRTAPAPQSAYDSLLLPFLPPSLKDEDVNVLEDEELRGLFPPSPMQRARPGHRAISPPPGTSSTQRPGRRKTWARRGERNIRRLRQPRSCEDYEFLLGPDFALTRGEERVRDSECEEHQAVAVKGVDGLAAAHDVEGDECDDGLGNANE
ncbi:hypothetical protein F5882DRAFT_441577 [Hyaloscypha sp. PMI_1271]|nr:hypothetical protein F5882DRAFT_441577 [Hyaloscypha sp. PMI_1271]